MSLSTDFPRLFPITLVSILAATSLVLVACGSDDGGVDRQASGGKTQAWERGVGNSYGGFRGIEVDFVNSYRYTKRPIDVGVAGTGKYCPDNPDRDNPCRDIGRGMDPDKVPHGQYGRWRSYNGKVLFSVDAYSLGKFQSTLTWPNPDESEGGFLNRINFAITNPFLKKPRFIIKSGRQADSGGCFLEASNIDVVVALKQNASRTLTDDDPFCEAKLKVTRLADSKEFIRFTVELL
ncbi:MAG: hypothetical protein ACKOB2_05195 [Solirubrobacterales bacterium]